MGYMNRKPNLISVILPVYNAAPYLPAALISILNQTGVNLELIAIDDHSTDESWDILKVFVQTDKRLKISRNSRNHRIAYTLNRGIKQARGQFIARMDADDISLPGRLKKQLHFLKNHPDVVIVGGQCQTIDSHGDRLGTKKFPTSNRAIRDMLYTNNPLQHPAVMINRALLPKNFAWYNTNFPPAEDLDLFFRLGAYGRYANLPNLILKYRQYPLSQTYKNPKNTFYFTQKVRQYAIAHYGYIPTTKAKLVSNLQSLAVNLIPNRLIYPLYSLLRGTRSLPSLLQTDKLVLWPKTSPKSSTVSLFGK